MLTCNLCSLQVAALATDAIPSVGYPTLVSIMGLGIILSAVVVIVRARKG